MTDFTAVPNHVVNAAYKRGCDESKAKIAALEADRANLVNLLVAVLFNDDDRARMKATMVEKYGVDGEVSVVITPDMTFLEEMGDAKV